MDFAEALRTLGSYRNARHPRDWYSMRNLAPGEAEVFIYDFIGFDPWFGGVSAADFVRELRALNATKILLRINSPGGDITEAVAIRNALIDHPAAVETHVDGIAASAASWVGLLPGGRVVMGAHTTMMIHEPFSAVYGDAATMRKEAEVLDHFAGQIADMFVEKAGGTRDEWRERMRTETWFTDEQAVEIGLADEVAGEPAAQNRYDPAILSIFKNTPAHLLKPAAARAPQATQTNTRQEPDADMVRAALVYQRDVSRRLGVAV